MPQSACREYHGERTGDAERHERPDEKETPGRLGDRRGEPIVSVNDGHAQRRQPAEEHDDVSGYPLGEQQCSAGHDEQHRQRDEDEARPSPIEPEGDVAADVKWQEYDRNQGCDRQRAGLHWSLRVGVEDRLIRLAGRAIRSVLPRLTRISLQPSA